MKYHQEIFFEPPTRNLQHDLFSFNILTFSFANQYWIWKRKKKKKKINCNNHLVIWVLYHYYSITIFLASFKLDFLYRQRNLDLFSITNVGFSSKSYCYLSCDSWHMKVTAKKDIRSTNMVLRLKSVTNNALTIVLVLSIESIDGSWA